MRIKMFLEKFGTYVIAAAIVAASALCLFAVFEVSFMAGDELETVADTPQDESEEIIETVNKEVYADAPLPTEQAEEPTEFKVPSYTLEFEETYEEFPIDRQQARQKADIAMTYASRILDTDLSGATVWADPYHYNYDEEVPSDFSYFRILPPGSNEEEISVSLTGEAFDHIGVSLDYSTVLQNHELSAEEYKEFEKACLMEFRRAKTYFMDDDAAFDRIVNMSLLYAYPFIPNTDYGADFIFLLKGGDGYRAFYQMTKNGDPVLFYINYITPNDMSYELENMEQWEMEQWQ